MSLFNPFRKGRRIQPLDLFSRTRNRLALFYTGIMAVFLLAFLLFAMVILLRTLANDQQELLFNVSERQYPLYESILVAQDPTAITRLGERISREGLSFAYLKNQEGQVVFVAENFGELSTVYRELIDGWFPRENEIRYVTVGITEEHIGVNGIWESDMRLMMLARPIYINGEIIGTLYTSFDITYYNAIFRWTLIVFLSVAVLFIGFGYLLSLWMARRALLPIRQAYDLQREFVSDASHELRTPLSVIQSTADALDMEVGRNDPFTERMLSTLKFEVKRMSGLIGELLLLAQNDSASSLAGSGTGMFDIRADSESILESFSAIAKEKGIALHLEGPTSLMVYGNRDKLMQLLYILLDNAIKYTPAGGQVAVELQPSTKKGRKQIQLTVTDTGIGIAPENQGRIFNRFFRVDKARSRQEGGYGLGLPIAKSIVESHQGEIHIDSELNNGTSIMIEIPSGSD